MMGGERKRFVRERLTGGEKQRLVRERLTGGGGGGRENYDGIRKKDLLTFMVVTDTIICFQCRLVLHNITNEKKAISLELSTDG